MDGIGGTIKNVVYRQVKSERVTINSASDFFETANRFVPSVTTLFQRKSEIFPESDDIKKAPSIPSTLKIHKLVRTSTHNGAEIQKFLSDSKRTLFCAKVFEIQCKMWPCGKRV